MLFSTIIVIFTISLTNSFSIKKTPEKYVHKFMIFNKKPRKKHVVEKHEDIFDKFEKVSRQGNRIMQEEYLKKIRDYLKKNNDSNNYLQN